MSNETTRQYIKRAKSMMKEEVVFTFPPTNDKRKAADMIISGARKGNASISSSMDLWLDWLLEIFSAEHFAKDDFYNNLLVKKKENADWYEALCRWFNDVRNERCMDFFGHIYEELFKDGYKAKELGQFFTPMGVSELCARVSRNEDTETIIVNDCACGSGRLLLGAYSAYKEEIRKDQKFHFFFGGDIDRTSVKMCALNLMVHGLQGIVVNQDALLLSKPLYGYLVNPTNAPVRTGMLSVQYLDSEECSKYVDWQDKEKRYGNFSRTLAHYKWLWDVVHDKEEKTETSVIKIEDHKIRREPIQLSLFD